MNKLLPIYDSILTYKQNNNDNRDEDEIVAGLLEDYGVNKFNYLRFVLFPDVYEPCRPPAIFPFPTHIYRDIGSLNLTATGGGLYLAWSPFTMGSSSIYSLLTTYNASNAVVPTGTIQATVTGEVEYTHTVPTVTGIDPEHVRGLGAYLQVSYIGRLDEMAGVIEVGVAIEDALNAASSASTRYVSTSALKGLYQYKKMDVSQGVRCVWLPLSVDAFEPVGKRGSNSNLNLTYHVHITGVSASANVFRLDWGYFYDGIVDESGFNILLPKKPQLNLLNKDDTVRAIHNSMDQGAVTPANPVDNGFASQLWNATKQSLAGRFVDKVDMGIQKLGNWVDNNSNMIREDLRGMVNTVVPGLGSIGKNAGYYLK